MYLGFFVVVVGWSFYPQRAASYGLPPMGCPLWAAPPISRIKDAPEEREQEMRRFEHTL